MELCKALVYLCAEHRDGQHVIVVALDDGDGFAHMAMTPEQAEILADVLLWLAHFSHCVVWLGTLQFGHHLYLYLADSRRGSR